MHTKRPSLLFFSCALAFTLLLCAAYSNHFDNSFHFDDAHSIEENLFIRDIRNLPRFFIDPFSFSSRPDHAGFRPLLSASLAVDYWLAGGLEPFVFHCTSFGLFLLQLFFMFLLFELIAGTACAQNHARWLALIASAIYGLHPANAETVNYIIQRGDIASTFGVVLALYLFIRFPGQRRYGWYLLPIIVSALAKIPSVMFAPILLVYYLLFESRVSLWPSTANLRAYLQAIRVSTPAIIVGFGLLWLHQVRTPLTSDPGGTSLYHYVITQPFVWFHYFRSFFLPLDLSADSDWELLLSVVDDRFFAGVAFVLVSLLLAVYCSRSTRLRPIAFGIAWFFIAHIPTSFVALAEVMNDHRMYFPFVGLTLAVSYGLYSLALCLPILQHSRGMKYLACSLLLLLALVAAYGTYQRNEVWHSPESFWYDVTIKSPKNGRGHMNYGLTLMARGEFTQALSAFERAHHLAPNYTTLEINLGIVKTALLRNIEAEQHFKRALFLNPRDADSYYYYAQWLDKIGRTAEAISLLESGLALEKRLFSLRSQLLELYAKSAQLEKYRALAQETLMLNPNDPAALSALR